MEIKNIANLTYLVIFHLKVIVYQNVNLPLAHGHHPKKHSYVI